MRERTDHTDEIASYRDLMRRPERFGEGFTGRTVIGAFFVGFIMMPGAIYMGLIAGVSLGAAAEWVTIILFSELARRSFSALTRQEIYLIYYIAGGLAGVVGGTMLAGGPFGQLVWHQYIVQSQAAAGFGITEHIPSWVTPQADSAAITGRSFLHKAWIPPIAVLKANPGLGKRDFSERKLTAGR